MAFIYHEIDSPWRDYGRIGYDAEKQIVHINFDTGGSDWFGGVDWECLYYYGVPKEVFGELLLEIQADIDAVEQLEQGVNIDYALEKLKVDPIDWDEWANWGPAADDDERRYEMLQIIKSGIHTIICLTCIDCLRGRGFPRVERPEYGDELQPADPDDYYRLLDLCFGNIFIHEALSSSGDPSKFGHEIFFPPEFVDSLTECSRKIYALQNEALDIINDARNAVIDRERYELYGEC